MSHIKESSQAERYQLELQWQEQTMNIEAAQIAAITALAQDSSSEQTIIDVFRKYEKAKEDLEQRMFAQIGFAYGYETLTTNTKGARSARWFDNNKRKFFSAGRASVCLAVACVHPEIGIGASHRTTVTAENTVPTMLMAVQDASFAKRLGEITREERLRMSITEESVANLIPTVVDEAMNELLSVKKSKYSFTEGPIEIITYGVYFLDPTAADSIGEVVRACSTTHAFMENRDTSSITFTNHIGKKGELRYGGKNHPKYNNPLFLKV